MQFGPKDTIGALSKALAMGLRGRVDILQCKWEETRPKRLLTWELEAMGQKEVSATFQEVGVVCSRGASY